MCGIIYARRRDKRPVKNTVLKRFKNQSSRGTKGFGVLTIKDGKVREVLRFEERDDVEKAMEKIDDYEILFHHRLPTSTPNYKDMTHPIVVKNKSLKNNYYVIHNGVIRNDSSLREKHIKLGFEYTTDMEEISMVKTKRGKVKEHVVKKFNDSESLAIELARFFDGKSDEIDAVGSIAFVCIETDKQDNVLNIHYGRNDGNPLRVENNGDLFVLKSEGHLKDKSESVPEDMIHTIEYATGKESARSQKVGRSSYSSSTTNTIGYGRYDDRDNFRGVSSTPSRATDFAPRLPLLSPVQRRQDGKLDWGDQFSEDDLPFGNENLPVINADDVDYDGMYEAYKVSEEHLIDLWAEIQSLEQDMKECRRILESGHLTTDDYIYNEEYLDECAGVLKERKKQAAELEDKLASMGR